MPESSFLHIFWLLSVLAEVAVVVRITQTGLGQQFKLLRVYLVASTLASLATAVAYYGFRDYYAYGYIFVAWAYLSTVFEFLVIQELCSSALVPFAAIRIASRRTLQGLWIVLVVVGAAWYHYLTLVPIEESPILRAAIRYQDSVSVGFALFVFVFLAFLAWMPVPLSRNQLNHSFLMGALFLFIGLSRFILEFRIFAKQIDLGSYIGLGGTLIVWVIWLIKIKPGKDESLNTPKGPVNRAEAEAMLDRLEELNRTLSRSGPGMLR